MRIISLSWLFLYSYIANFCSSDVVLVSGYCQSDQQELLVGLKDSLNSSFTMKLMKWNQNTDCCSWEGISCDADGRVVELDLSFKLISGTIDNSSNLFHLQHLRRLNLAYNLFKFVSPSGFDKLPDVSHLNLSNAIVDGHIPLEISHMTKLVTLDLSASFLSLKLEMPKLEILFQNLTRLRFLHLDGINITAKGSEWCQALSTLNKLQILSMSNCYLSGPIGSSLSKLRSLSLIRLDNNNFSAPIPKFFAEFPNLTSLQLSFAGLMGRFPEDILHLPKLQSLDLSYNELLTGSFQNFSLNSSLQTLVLSNTKFGGPLPESIGNLKQLARIELAHCNFSGPIPKSVKKFTQLVHLDFSWNNFSGLIPSFLLLRNLVPLDLSRNNFSGPMPSFSSSRNLAHLDFSTNKLSGPMPSFTSSTNLTHLKLAYNQLNGTINSTNWSSLFKLVSIDLQNNRLSGTIPPALFRIPLLQEIHLSHNQFNGSLHDVHGKASLLLNTLDLSSNKLQGQFPMFVFELQGLEVLKLSSNNFSGFIQGTDIQLLRNLSELDLSYNHLSVDDANTTESSMFSFPNITTLMLASCNLKKFPGFLQTLPDLITLDLSNNQISGEIPYWIWEFKSLLYLNLSQNFLTNFGGPIPNIKLLYFIDLQGNQLQGHIPFVKAGYMDYSNNNFSSMLPTEIGDFLQFAIFFSLSGNKIQGNIPESICDSSYLQVLDLSNNSLSGSIPQCLIQMSTVSLGVLNLKGNKLSGIISDTFPENCSLHTLDLNQNQLGGKVPKSLVNCRMLEVLHLGHNQINDTFPCHLKDTSRLRILVLRSNKFKGNINCPGNNVTWPMLQIIDLASNYFSGKLPHECLINWNAMKVNEDGPYSKHLQFELQQVGDGYSYYDAIMVTGKGLDLKLVKILTIFTSIDLSFNKFEGPIPEAIREFKALYMLNLSNNALTGTIPPFLGNLPKLESLDLSSNHLSGQIPLQLANLNFLSFLNLSNNKLVGKIPTGTQLQSFSESSFENNTGLCGPPLEVECNLHSHTKNGSNSETRLHADWNLLSIELGFIFGIGIVIAPLIFWERWRTWYYMRIDRVLLRLFPMVVLKKRK